MLSKKFYLDLYRNRKFMEAKESKSHTHFWISLIKSGIRIVACWRLFEGDLHEAAGFLIIAEALGIAEEIF